MQSLEKMVRQEEACLQSRILDQSAEEFKPKECRETDRLLELEKLFYIIPDGKYLVKGKDEEYIVTKRHDRNGKDPYGREVPVVEIEPLRDSVPLKRDAIPYGIRGFCFPATKESYVHIDDVDTYRVNYHENLHMKIYRTDPNHPEWEIRMLEDWRLGEENRR